MVLLSLVLMNTGCDEHIDTPAVNPSEEKLVEVGLNIGFADEADACNLSASTKANTKAKGKGAFDVELVPTAATRADASVKPDGLYKLEIRQYKQNGECYTSSGQDPTDQGVGKRLTVSLAEDADCQLVFVAWGQNSSKSLGKVVLSKAQEISVDAATINAISPTDMSQMPYVLHLKHVNVTSDGKITNPDGEDVRILLKRLATRLNISWDYAVTGYDLKQIILQSIPRNYKVVPVPDEKSLNTYPSVMDQYMDIQLADDQVNAANKSYSCWVPANVRGINTVSNGPQYRIKENAPMGSSYVSFIAANTSDRKKKLNYRIYLGGKDYSDYNLNENTDYSYKISFKHTDLPVDDKRVTIIDPIPASENNENFVPTANCFMVAPGGAFCFDPFTYQQNGKTITNSTLKDWSDSENGIAYVKLLWQTKENGDIGDPIMGVVNSNTDHINIVDILRNDRNEVTLSDPLTDAGQGRIYCRVAPNTTGGNGVIAACNRNGDILWSWHVWVTDYSPDSKGNVSVDEPTKRKQKYTNRGASQLPMMDRNLGAMAGYIVPPSSALERAKTNGFHYQWGRKDLFPSTYTSDTDINEIKNIDLLHPTKGLLNLYQPDGISYYERKVIESTTTFREAYKNPTTLYKTNNNSAWSDFANLKTAWGGDATKTIHDPCPAGWRVTQIADYFPLFNSNPAVNTMTTMNMVNNNSLESDGGAVIRFESSSTGRTTYIRFTGYWSGATDFSYIGISAHIWCRDNVYSNGGNEQTDAGRLLFIHKSNDKGSGKTIYNGYLREALPLRCIQERE